ncbi:hypothetical protein GTA08_BOTSDO01053 [Botryosphaeria dothidea]|uniref:Myb-like domain-containing protein n=1 Tax=Botryosphaeria dothidea TaxID=55169 RepID=A0A8H4J6P7_9PEZI|nr:hypothetical protein GTA08_BOTSDO01053 [Botryosphaeria dothidea]
MSSSNNMTFFNTNDNEISSADDHEMSAFFDFDLYASNNDTSSSNDTSFTMSSNNMSPPHSTSSLNTSAQGVSGNKVEYRATSPNVNYNDISPGLSGFLVRADGTRTSVRFGTPFNITPPDAMIGNARNVTPSNVSTGSFSNVPLSNMSMDNFGSVLPPDAMVDNARDVSLSNTGMNNFGNTSSSNVSLGNFDNFTPLDATTGNSFSNTPTRLGLLPAMSEDQKKGIQNTFQDMKANHKYPLGFPMAELRWATQAPYNMDGPTMKKCMEWALAELYPNEHAALTGNGLNPNPTHLTGGEPQKPPSQTLWDDQLALAGLLDPGFDWDSEVPVGESWVDPAWLLKEGEDVMGENLEDEENEDEDEDEDEEEDEDEDENENEEELGDESEKGEESEKELSESGSEFQSDSSSDSDSEEEDDDDARGSGGLSSAAPRKTLPRQQWGGKHPETRWDSIGRVIYNPGAALPAAPSAAANLGRNSSSPPVEDRSGLPWSVEEEQAAGRAMEWVLERWGRKGLTMDQKYQECAERLRAGFRFSRPWRALKAQYSRSIRARTGVDERRTVKPHRMQTCVQKTGERSKPQWKAASDAAAAGKAADERVRKEKAEKAEKEKEEKRLERERKRRRAAVDEEVEEAEEADEEPPRRVKRARTHPRASSSSPSGDLDMREAAVADLPAAVGAAGEEAASAAPNTQAQVAADEELARRLQEEEAVNARPRRAYRR